MATDPESLLADALAELTETLSTRGDEADLHRLLVRHARRLLGQVAVCSFAVADEELRPVASSSAWAGGLARPTLELMTRTCQECRRRRQIVRMDRSHASSQPGCERLDDLGREHGLHTVLAVPMRAGDDVVGVLGIGLPASTPPPPATLLRGLQSLLDTVATVRIQQSTIHQLRDLTQQLQRALDSRVVIEQAKGMVAAQSGLDLPSAFELLRRHARHDNREIHEVALAVTTGELPVDVLAVEAQDPPAQVSRRAGTATGPTLDDTEE
jgi:GAF domain-containing protein